jgi:hypothetical protein
MKRRTPLPSAAACLLTSLLLGCGHMLPKPDESCEQLAGTFHRLAADKDRGTTLEEQRQLVRDERSYAAVQRYLYGVLAVIYDHPELNADQIRNQVRDSCRVDSDGRIEMPPDWDPWTHSA